jgi:hypothetical protein
MLNGAMAEPVPRVVTLIGQCVPAGMAQHVDVNLATSDIPSVNLHVRFSPKRWGNRPAACG